MHRAEKSTWTFILIAVCFVVFILELFTPIEKYTYFVPAYALSRPWAFITSIFLHADFSHLFFNMFALFIFGVYLEPRVSGKAYLLIFFLAGIVGNLGYMLTAFDSTIPGLGASGAIYGIMGAVAVLDPYAIVYLGFVPMPMIVAAFIWTITEFLGLFVPGNVAHGSHLAGLFVGAVFGFYLKRQKKIFIHF
jgi:membrane associated rhomboid family serine protease